VRLPTTRLRGKGLRAGAQIHAIVALLIAALAMAVLLTFRAQYAITSHRAVVEGALRDYAALVGDEALRRIALQVGIYGYRQGLRSLREELDGAAPQPITPSELAVMVDGPGERGVELMARTFVYERSQRRWSASEPRPSVDAWLAAELARLELEERSDFEVLHAELDGRPVSAVVGALDARGDWLVGFEVDRGAVSRWCAAALEGPLLPPTLADGELDNGALYLRVLDSHGREVYAVGERADAGLVVERTLPADYLSVLQGLKVVAGIRTDAASRLVIGGLPRSELPLLLTLLALIGGLVAAALVLLRRERELVRLRSDFVSRVSHELRTPLAQIRMFAETLRLGRVRNDGERRRSLEIMDRESRRLSALVENILQFSRAERGGVQLAPRRVAVKRLLGRLADDLDVLARPAGTKLVVDAPDSLEVLADEDALRQILINLVDNAIKYGPREQEVTLGAAANGGAVRLWVEDEGAGVPAGERERVWQPFLRIRSEHGSVAGTGIGLAVVRELVEQHGGRCWLEPREPHGTRVVIELPGDSEGGDDTSPFEEGGR
jgi:signal transduction histidine kinase